MPQAPSKREQLITPDDGVITESHFIRRYRLIRRRKTITVVRRIKRARPTDRTGRGKSSRRVFAFSSSACYETRGVTRDNREKKTTGPQNNIRRDDPVRLLSMTYISLSVMVTGRLNLISDRMRSPVVTGSSRVVRSRREMKFIGTRRDTRHVTNGAAPRSRCYRFITTDTS